MGRVHSWNVGTVVSKHWQGLSIQYRSQLTWQTSASSEELTRGLVVHTRVQKVASEWYSRAQALAHALASTYRRRGPIIVLKRQWWQHRDSRQFTCLSYFLMRTGEFADKRGSKRLARSRQASTLQFSCQVLSTRERNHEYFHTPRHKMFWRALTSLWAKRGSKSIVFKVASFLRQVSNTCACTREHQRLSASACARSARAWDGHMQVLEIDSRVGAILHTCHSHSFVKLAVTCTVIISFFRRNSI